MAREPEFAAAYNEVVSRSGLTSRDLFAKRTQHCHDNRLSPCCDSDFCESRDACYENCGGGWGGVGCVAGKTDVSHHGVGCGFADDVVKVARRRALHRRGARAQDQAHVIVRDWCDLVRR